MTWGSRLLLQTQPVLGPTRPPLEPLRGASLHYRPRGAPEVGVAIRRLAYGAVIRSTGGDKSTGNPVGRFRTMQERRQDLGRRSPESLDAGGRGRVSNTEWDSDEGE